MFRTILATLILISAIFSPFSDGLLKIKPEAESYYRQLAVSPEKFRETLKYFHVPSTNYRLNLTVAPVSYTLRMRPVLDDGFPGLEKFTAPGSVVIRAESVTSGSCSTIVMHQRGLSINENDVTVMNLATGQNLSVIAHEYEFERDFYTIHVEPSFEYGNQLEISIPFTANLSQTDNLGIYLGNYVDPETNETRYLSTTKLEPYHARKVFPLFDEPSLKATFKVIVGRLASKYHSLSNTEITQTEPDTEHPGWVWDHYEETVLMSPYLMCFIVSDFTSESRQAQRNITVSAWAPNHDVINGGAVYGAETGGKILAHFESKFKMNYALKKLDAVALPQFASGAMENFGLVTYRYEYLVWIPGESTEAERRKVTQVLAHEIAHQWYGNIVTCAWWSEIWLNEGFARFLQFWGMRETIPEFLVEEAFVNDVQQLAMVFDQGPLSHPVKNSAESPEESSAVFDRISYEKGASLLKMMEGFLSPTVFESGIIDVYLPKMQWKSAYQDDLFDALQTALEAHNATHLIPSGITIKEVMSDWTLIAGYPVLRVNREDNTMVSFTKEKFVVNSTLIKKKTSTEVDLLWWLPVKVVSADKPSYSDKLPDFWFPKNESAAFWEVDTTKWIMVNPDCSGYYRVLYDAQLSELIRQQLISNHSVISSSSRSQFFDDYFHLAFANYVTIETALEMTQYLLRESSANVWTSVLTHLRPVFNRFTENEAALEAFKGNFLPHLEGALSIIGVRQVPGERGIKVTLRAALLDMACQLGMQECSQYANELMNEWMARPGVNPFPVDIRPSLYCAAVASSENDTVSRFLLEQFHSTSKDAQKLVLVQGLSCSKNLTTLSNLMILTMTDLHEYRTTTLSRIAMNPIGRAQVYEFLKSNLIAQRLSPTLFADVVSTLSVYWNRATQIEELQLFMQANEPILVPVKTSLEASLRNIQTCINWWAEFGNRIHAWLL